MNIYDLLRELVRCSARSGMMDKNTAFQAIDLIAKLERMSSFGSTATTVKGTPPT